MGYSGRYHAASLAAVFIALAVGILIGIGLADDVVSSASEELESSLRTDLSAAEDKADDLQTQLDRSDRFSSLIIPEVLAGRLVGRRVALVEIGGTDEELVSDTRDAVETADGELAAVAQIALPPDEQALIDDLQPRYAKLRNDPDSLTKIGEAVGRELAGGGPTIRRLAPDLFARFSGDLRGVDDVVIARIPPEELSAGQRPGEMGGGLVFQHVPARELPFGLQQLGRARWPQAELAQLPQHEAQGRHQLLVAGEAGDAKGPVVGVILEGARDAVGLAAARAHLLHQARREAAAAEYVVAQAERVARRMFDAHSSVPEGEEALRQVRLVDEQEL